MSSPNYQNLSVDADAKVDFSKVAGKTVVLTGGMHAATHPFVTRLELTKNIQGAVAWGLLTSMRL